MAAFSRLSAFTILIFAITLDCPIARAQTQPAAESRNIEEAQRLRSILRRYYNAEAERESEVAAGIAKNSEVADRAGEAHNPGQVLLNGAQGMLALQNVSQRLTDSSIGSQRRPSNIIFHAEVRRDGILQSSESHSLKPLGKSQYVSKISLPGGEVALTIREQAWSFQLPGADSADFIFTLSTLDEQHHEFHVIPVSELLGTNRSDFPAWLPPIGAAPNATPGL